MSGEKKARTPLSGTRTIEVEKENDVDAAVGLRIMMRRRELKITKKRLGEMVGISGMQIGYHESGARRLAAARLYDLSLALDVPISYFFTDLNREDTAVSGAVEAVEVMATPDIETVEAIVRLAKLTASIEDESTRLIIREMLKGLPLFKGLPLPPSNT